MQHLHSVEISKLFYHSDFTSNDVRKSLKMISRKFHLITVTVEEPVDEVIHEDNEWGISLVDEDVADDANDASEVAKGVRLAYERRVTREADSAPVLENDPPEEQSLEELMKQMKNM